MYKFFGIFNEFSKNKNKYKLRNNRRKEYN